MRRFTHRLLRIASVGAVALGLGPGLAHATPGDRAIASPAGPGRILSTDRYPAEGNALSVSATGWSGAQFPSDHGVPEPSRIQFGPPPGAPSDPHRPATDVAHFSLDPFSLTPHARNGDVTDIDGETTNRVEVWGRSGGHRPAHRWPDPPGSVRWYSFSVFLPAGFPTATSPGQWFIFTQWKSVAPGSPPVAMQIRGDDFWLGGATSGHDLGAIVRGQWTHFVVGLAFSDSAARGWETVYRDGVALVQRAPARTLEATIGDGESRPAPSYLKMGIYRSVTWRVAQDLYLTPMTIGTTRGSVS